MGQFLAPASMAYKSPRAVAAYTVPPCTAGDDNTDAKVL